MANICYPLQPKVSDIPGVFKFVFLASIDEEMQQSQIGFTNLWF